MEGNQGSRPGHTDPDYLPPLPPRPQQKHKKNFCENLIGLWAKIPNQLQGPVKICLIVLGCILALIIAFLIGYDTAKSKYRGGSPGHTSSESEDDYNTFDPSPPVPGPCDGEYPYPGDCLKFFRCEAGAPVAASCPAHHSFDPARRACVWIHLSTCGKDSAPAPPPGPAPSGDVPPNIGQVRAEEARVTGQGEISLLKKRLKTLDSVSVELVRPGRAANPANTKLVESIIQQKDWDFLFPQRHESYTYTNFLKAVSKFPAVCHPDSEAVCRRVLATMFAHFTQETGGHNPSGAVPQWRQGLHYIEELGCDARDCGYSKNCAGTTQI